MKPVQYKSLEWQERRRIREAYTEEQEGLCHHCKTPLSGPPRSDIADMPIKLKLFPPNFFKYPVHLHHSHKTGLTIGAIHAQCNAYLWQYKGE